jgi:hypothetical protein
VTVEGLHPPLCKLGTDCLQILLYSAPAIDHSPMKEIFNTHFDSLTACTWRLAAGRSAPPYLRQPARSHVTEDARNACGFHQDVVKASSPDSGLPTLHQTFHLIGMLTAERPQDIDPSRRMSCLAGAAHLHRRTLCVDIAEAAAWHSSRLCPRKSMNCNFTHAAKHQQSARD